MDTNTETVTDTPTTPTPAAAPRVFPPGTSPSLKFVLRQNGIVAGALRRGTTVEMLAEHEEHRPLFEQALRLLDITAAPAMRVVLGNKTIQVRREGTSTYVVAYATGAEIAKSVLRVIRRAEPRA
jgi:hypothetical protein